MPTFQLIVETLHLKIPPASDLIGLEDAGPDEPVRLVVAPYLPEIGGAWSDKVLRNAIARGDLEAEKIGRTIYVTRRGIADWRRRCAIVHPRHSESRTFEADTDTTIAAAMAAFDAMGR